MGDTRCNIQNKSCNFQNVAVKSSNIWTFCNIFFCCETMLSSLLPDMIHTAICSRASQRNKKSKIAFSREKIAACTSVLTHFVRSILCESHRRIFFTLHFFLGDLFYCSYAGQQLERRTSKVGPWFSNDLDSTRNREVLIKTAINCVTNLENIKGWVVFALYTEKKELMIVCQSFFTVEPS